MTRPTSFAEFTGQRTAVLQLDCAVRATKLRGGTMPHVLLEGPPGCGKTSLAASVLPNELSAIATTVVCSAVSKPEDLLPTLSTQKAGAILFLDEIHALPRQLFENLYSVMEDSRLTVIIGEPPNRQPITVDLPRFTIIGATTREGLLPEPLLDRFPLKARLSLYGPDDMRKILSFYFQRHSDRPDLPTDQVLDLLVPACHGTPRVAVHLVGLTCDVALLDGSRSVQARHVQQMLDMQKISPAGLNERESALLAHLALQGRSVGLTTLAHVLDSEVATIENVVEPWLLYIGAIEKTPAGRVITPKGRQLAHQGKP